MSNLCEFQPQVPITETVAPLRSDTLQGNDDGVGGPEGSWGVSGKKGLTALVGGLLVGGGSGAFWGFREASLESKDGRCWRGLGECLGRRVSP